VPVNENSFPTQCGVLLSFPVLDSSNSRCLEWAIMPAAKKIVVFATSFTDELVTHPEGEGQPLRMLQEVARKQDMSLELRTDRNPGEPLSEEELDGAVAVIADLETYSEELLGKVGRGAGGDLGLIARYGIGYNSVDVRAAARHGVLVTNTPGANTRPTAEWTVATLLSVAGRQTAQHEKASRGRPKSGPSRLDVSGRTLGVIGTGRIGRAVIELLRPFGMRVLACDPVQDEAWAAENGVSYTSLSEVCRTADFITLHASAGEQLIGRDELALMSPTTVLINCARGVLVDNQAVHAAVARGDLWGYGIDEVWEYPDLSLEGLNIIASPHVGSDTDTGKLNMQFSTARAVAAFLEGRRPEHVVE
jgi:phosphoglycerate dehydrogenase-like enzyme